MRFRYLLVILIAFNFGCSDDTLKNNIIQYHFALKSNTKAVGNVEVIEKKSIDSKFSAILYELNNETLHYGILTKDDKILKVFKVKNKLSNTDFFNQGCMVNSKGESNNLQNQLPCYTVFVGEVPFENYSKIKLNWNCSNDDYEDQALINGKYFFFIKNKKDVKVCNIVMINDKNEETRTEYDVDTGRWVEI